MKPKSEIGWDQNIFMGLWWFYGFMADDLVHHSFFSVSQQSTNQQTNRDCIL